MWINKNNIFGYLVWALEHFYREHFKGNAFLLHFWRQWDRVILHDPSLTSVFPSLTNPCWAATMHALKNRSASSYSKSNNVCYTYTHNAPHCTAEVINPECERTRDENLVKNSTEQIITKNTKSYIYTHKTARR